MGTEDVRNVLEIVVGFIIIPWCAWVTASIFGQKTQTAILKAELESVRRIESAVQLLVEAALKK